MDKNITPEQKKAKSIASVSAEPCSVERGMRIIGGKWTGSVIYYLKDGPVRFNELCRRLSGASRKMVDQRLKELEKQNLVKRTVLAERPIAVSYELTEFGYSTFEVLEPLRLWTEKHGL
ncbi:winged helix-turn-helix transcriptional regulator [Salinimonas chungwhensis]|uniref:winged helix-turn-helix transcriptional regulator n=1 Tax=Salinimonas chungwhensis TaxID=265425 RepID=UPI0003703592|nr:helix-turn-helix domain-containing protein [Salinimonas chungwhensis]